MAKKYSFRPESTYKGAPFKAQVSTMKVHGAFGELKTIQGFGAPCMKDLAGGCSTSCEGVVRCRIFRFRAVDMAWRWRVKLS